MLSLSRVTDLAGKAWRYLLTALEHPQRMPHLALLAVRGVHVQEFLKLNQPWVKKAGITTIIDIGAHAGEFASAALAILPDVRIYSFEPLPDCYERLRNKFQGNASVQTFQVALGERNSEVQFWRSNFTKSSSLLRMDKLHQIAFPWSSQTVPVTVSLKRLDDYLNKIELTPKALVKIDVQGYEDRVLDGGAQFLKGVDYIVVEVSFRALYEGQAGFHRVYDFLRELGFSYAGNVDQLLSPLDGSILQADALFVR